MARWDGRYTWDVPPSATGTPACLRVATCQMPVTHDVRGNLAYALDLIRQAKAAGADVAYLPECALSGYGPASWPDWAGFDWGALDEAVAAVRAEARACGLWVVAGSVHRDGPQARPTNALLVIDRQGDVAGRYDKRRCSANDLRAFASGMWPLVLEIDRVRCGFLVCLDWAFPELWTEMAGQVELVFHSCVADGTTRNRIETHTIPALMQDYAWLNQHAISVSNSCRPGQVFPSFWIERSGHAGLRARPDEAGLVVNALADDPGQDRFFDMVRAFRRSATDGSLYAPHLPGASLPAAER